MSASTKSAYRFTFHGRGMEKPAIRYLSRLRLAAIVQQTLARMGCKVSPIAKVRIRRCRGFDDERYAGILAATKPHPTQGTR